MKVVSGSPWGQLGPGGVRGGVWVPVGGRCHRRSVSSEVMSPHHCCFPIIIRPGRGRRGRGPSRRQPSENRGLPAFLSSSLPFSETLWLGHRSPQGGWAARYLSPATSREEVWAHAPCKSVRLAWGQSGMCSAARDSSVTAGLVWACLRRACLRPARTRALGEGSGGRQGFPAWASPPRPASFPPSLLPQSCATLCVPRCRGGRLPLVLCGGWGRRLAGFSACGGRSRGGVRVPLHCDWRARAWPPQPGFRPALPRCGVKPWLAASSTLGSWLCHRLLVRVPTLLSSVSVGH